MGLFKRRTKLPSTGNSLDDDLLAEIAKVSDVTVPREWIHYLYAADEAAARAAAAAIIAGGWEIKYVDKSAADDDTWIVVAFRPEAVTSPEAVVAARHFFEQIAARTPGGDYDGWEASA